MNGADEDDILAGEFALGVLDGDALRAAEERVAADPRFAALVEGWRERLAPLAAGSNEVPSNHVWASIERRLAANDDAPPSHSEQLMRRWRVFAIASSAVAASLALVLVTRPPAEMSPPPAQLAGRAMVATLRGEETASVVTISADAGGRLLVTPVSLPVGGRTSELWIIPEDGKPRSLGVIPAASPSIVGVAPAHRGFLHRGATFAVSLEPAGGSPTGLPTGPVVASGKIGTI